MKKGNEQAYPMDFARDGFYMQNGLTKRELFAMAAMQGMLAANTSIPMNHDKMGTAIHAVQQADALLEELEKTEV